MGPGGEMGGTEEKVLAGEAVKERGGWHVDADGPREGR